MFSAPKSRWIPASAAALSTLLYTTLDSKNDSSQRTTCSNRLVSSTLCEEPVDSYPNFCRHGKNCLLKEFLSRQVYEELKDLQTASGVTLEDIIKSGVALPHGANPPRGAGGVYVGDAESYHLFAPFLDPLIAKIHYEPASHDTNMTAIPVVVQRMSTIHRDDAHHILSQRADPTGDYILFSRMRIARSVAGFNFGPCISRGDRRRIEDLLKTFVQDDWGTGQYVSVFDMTNDHHDELIQRHLLFSDPDEFAISAGLGRDWPDGRGVYYKNPQKKGDNPDVMIWCNAEDHFKVICMRKGGDLQGTYQSLREMAKKLENSLQRRGFEFSKDARLGYLNASPTNLGTAFRASVFVKLVRLGQQPGFRELLERMRLEAYTPYEIHDKRYTGIFDISHVVRLGQSESQLINVMIKGVGELIALERRLEQGETLDLTEIRVTT